jgi:hypothetical protein
MVIKMIEKLYTPEEIWNDIPSNDSMDMAHDKVWIYLKDIQDELNLLVNKEYSECGFKIAIKQLYDKLTELSKNKRE